MSREEEARAWAQRLRRLEPKVMSWIYDDGGDASLSDLARRTLAQTVGLRRLLDQIAARAAREEQTHHEVHQS